MAVHDVREEILQQVKAILIISLAALALAALLFPGQTGEIGKFINNVIRTLTGEVSVILPILVAANGLLNILPWKIPNLGQRKAGVLLIFLILLVYAHLELMTGNFEIVQDMIKEAGIYKTSFRLGLQQQGGGVAGALLSLALYFLLRDLGSRIILLALVVISFILITNISLASLFRTAWRCLSMLARLSWQVLKKTGRFLAGPAKTETAAATEKEAAVPAPEQPDNKQLSFNYYQDEKDAREEAKETVKKEIAGLEIKTIGSTQQKARQSAIDFPVEEKSGQAGTGSAAAALSPGKGTYVLPSVDLLTKKPVLRDAKAKKTIAERAKILERTLQSFGVSARVTNALAGPTVTRYELQPERGVKVSKIVALADDLALNLAAPDVRIEAPIPGKAAVGIEVPNKVIAPVYLREVLEDDNFVNSASVLTVALGKDITGNPVVADLMKMPHLLIAGSTGSGKSVCINVIVTSILFKARPSEVKFVMIDPKVVELSNFNGIPHLLMPVVTSAKRASLALKNMVKEMTRRYEIFAQESVRDIHSYNDKKLKQNEEDKLLPFIVVIIDELADLMMVAAADVEDSIARLAQMSRAAGIHLVIATQRPSVDVITGVIKANITSRIAFAVSSQADSRTILDMGGAEKLLGRGDALFHPLGQSKPFRIQGAFINEQELQKLLQFIKNQAEPEYEESIFPEENEEEVDYEEDELLPEALMLFAQAGMASISLLQRRLRIGYTRAARLVDDMERRGFVGQYEGSKAREVLVTPEQVRKMFFEDENKNNL
ncbi:MAG: DNA translocase FtsK [Bacillota bacterium]|jgi:S-DNA-T family DNA segregation ATPase FtsK/SpoIIIE|nr:DNA translocase FtsK [Bacillota bacterium]HHU29550.1 DNA translocase FtsK [Bacillota bacterium]